MFWPGCFGADLGDSVMNLKMEVASTVTITYRSCWVPSGTIVHPVTVTQTTRFQVQVFKLKLEIRCICQPASGNHDKLEKPPA